MKHFLTFAIFFSFILCEACKKDEPLRCQSTENYRSTGVMNRADVLLACACCSRYFITIDSQTYQFMQVPAGSGIDVAHDEMPMIVSLNWHLDTGYCASSDNVVIDAVCRK